MWWTDRPPMIVFLGISFGWSKKPAKQGNEIKTKNLSQRTLPAFILCRTFTQRMTNELFPPKNKPPQASVQLGTQRLGKMSNSEIQWIRTCPESTFITRATNFSCQKTMKNLYERYTSFHSNEQQSYTHQNKR